MALSCGLKAALASRFVAGKVLTSRMELTVTSALTSVQRPEAETSFLKDRLLVLPHESVVDEFPLTANCCLLEFRL